MAKTNVNRDRGWKHNVCNGIARFEIWGENARIAVQRIYSKLSGIEMIENGKKLVIKVATKLHNETFKLLLDTLANAPTSA